MLNIKKLLVNMLKAIPIGQIEMYGGGSNPSGWLICDGSAVSRTTYSALFAVIGTTFGSGNGSTTFNLPDFSGRMPLGASTTYPLSGSGSTGGAATVTLTASQSGTTAHSHGGTYTNPKVDSSGTCNITSSGGHSHPIDSKYNSPKFTAVTSGTSVVNLSTSGTSSGTDIGSLTVRANSGTHTHTVPNHTHTLSGGGYSVSNATAANASAAHENMPPYRTINFIIYAGV